MEPTFFDKLFESIDLQERSNYLKQLLESSSSLKSAFLSTYQKQGEEVRLQSKTSYNKDEALKEILELSDELREILDSLDFEETDWDSWHNNSGHYMDDFEISAMLAEEEAEEVFEDYITEFKDNLVHENFYNIALNISYLMHGILQSNISDPNNNLGDPANDYFIDATNTVVKNNLAEYHRRKFLAEDYAYGFELMLLTNQWYPDKDDFMKAMAPFLINTINDRETASIIWSLLNAYGIGLKKIPGLLNHITSKLGNKELWLKMMEETFLDDYKNSILLMDYYYQHNRTTFEEKAMLLFDRFGHNSTEYLVDKINKGTSLHIELLKKMAGSGSAIRYYNELKKYIDDAALRQFISGIQDINLKAKLLGSEKMYDELERLIRKEYQNAYGYFSLDFNTAIRPFFEAKPDLAFELLNLRVNHLMRFARNRESYKQIAGILNDSLGIKGHEKEVKGIVDTLYNQQKPQLPALKDELRKAGLVETKTNK
ncbi:MAG: hypothetical protein AB9834_04855 [Lentimicrobium sp.]